MAFDAGIRIKRYHADNGIFVSEEYRNELELKEQVLDLSGVGAHFQNGKSERHIRTICALARAMMIHSALHWPDAHNLDQWPMAMDHAVWIWNNLPSEGDEISPEEKFTRQKAARPTTIICAQLTYGAHLVMSWIQSCKMNIKSQSGVHDLVKGSSSVIPRNMHQP